MRRTAEPPVIDGLLDDEVWLTAPVARNFVMLNPGNGPSERPSQKSEVRMLFDDEFLYVGARMFDAHPDSILTEYTPRDVYNRNHDWFGIFINPYNDGISDFNFRVTSAGVQSDSRNTVDGEDQGWNTVWYSKVRIDEQGWIVEMAIPYQSLRFAEDGPTSWGLNMLRYIRRKREEYSWNFIDKSVGTYEQQCGMMNGMVGVEPPVRLSFLPYLSGYMNDYQGQTDYSYRLGLDMKYGINESFTLDATLVPDFGQVPFDDQQLNLSPFELQFEENRPFFNEGVDLFSKGDLFYSRRIGGAPNNVTNAQASDTTLQPSIPEFTQLYNAVKLSGRTGGNLGIGVFNAVTANNYQEFTDPVSGARESVLIEPLTNYNILVFDQRLNRNSSLSLVNTSVLRNGDAHDALVTGLVTDLMNKKNSWRLNQEYIMSQRFFTDSVDRGFRISNRLSRIKGNFRFELGQELMTDRYNINDLGFLRRANRSSYMAKTSYQIFQPQGWFIRYELTAYTQYDQLFEPNVFNDYDYGLEYFFITKKFLAFGGGWNSKPVGSHDYFEPRTPGMYWKRPKRDSFYGWFSTDYRRPFALDMRFRRRFWHGYDFAFQSITIEPRYRFSDHFTLVTELERERNTGDIGWATFDQGAAVFGRRDRENTRLEVRGIYVFNEVSSLNLNIRYLWTTVDYTGFYSLDDQGGLEERAFADQLDLNFTSWNVDLKYSWWFAPASELVVLYRNALLDLNDRTQQSLSDNISGLFELPQAHNFSVRFTYFLDYNSVFRRSRSRKS